MTEKKKSSLFVGHFGTAGNTPPPGDPLSITPMDVDVDRISFFDGNPRRSPNDKYAEIKESIRTSGLDNPLPISRRPSDPPGHYIIYKGGNTRLRVLKELWAETKDPKFLKVRCEFHPFVSDTDALIAHLRENDLRGGMTFIDRALAVQDARAGLEAELGETLSLRKLEEAFKERGFPISNGMISKLEYAARLNSVIPSALKTGTGKDQIEKLAKLEKAIREVWRFHSDPDGKDDEFRETVFFPALKRSDSESWNYDTAESQVKDRLLAVLPQGTNTEAVLANCLNAMSGKELKVAVQEAMQPQPAPSDVTLLPQQDPIPPSSTGGTGIHAFGGDAPAIGGGSSLASTASQGTAPDSHELSVDDSWGSSLDGDAGIESWMPQTSQREVIIGGNGRWLDTLNSLRKKCYGLAVKLADGIPKGRESLAEVGFGYGFLIRDVFNEEYMTNLHARAVGDNGEPPEQQQAAKALDHANALWWFLVETSGSFADERDQTYTCPDHMIEPLVSPNSYVRDPELMLQFHPVVHHPERLRALWMYLPDARRAAAIDLINTVVAIADLITQHQADTDGASLWEVVTE